ncbi:MAG: TolC family protein [Myxococcota bacterium]|nr:TolC family protein [Myxococcota bacterium]
MRTRMIGVVVILAGVVLASPRPGKAGPPPDSSVMTLRDAVAIAVAQSDDLVAVRAAFTRAEAVRRRALSGIVPTLSGQASYTLNDEEIRSGAGVIVPRDNGSGALGMSMTIFDGRAIPMLLAANDRFEAARATLDDARTELRYRVADAYISVLAAEALDRVSLRAVSARKSQIAAAKARLDTGLGLSLDVYRATAAFHRAERERVGTDAQVEAARDVLAALLGRMPPFEHPLERPRLEPVPAPGEARARAQALMSRQDLEAQALSLRAAERMRLATWLSFLPSIELSGNMSMGRETFANPDGVQFQLSLQLTWLLYDGGTRYAQLQEDTAAIREAEANRRITERNVVTGVRTALRTIRTADAAILSASAESKAANEAVRSVGAQFQIGRATGLEVLEGQLALEQAEVEFVRAELDALRARLQLIRILGELP